MKGRLYVHFGNDFRYICCCGCWRIPCGKKHLQKSLKNESFRKMISEIPKKLGEREYIYKVGMAYGFWEAELKDVVFYFEKVR